MQNRLSKVLVVGLGETGASVARFLSRQSIPFMATDSRKQPPKYKEFKKLYPQVEVRLGDFDEDFFLSADSIVLSPGVSLQTSEIQHAVAKGIPVIGDIELFAREISKSNRRHTSVVAITGTNGKSTVTDLFSNMAKRSGLKVVSGGNFNPPALDLIVDGEENDLYVLELSSFQLEITYSLKPTASTVLNISKDHFDRYNSLADYAKAKQKVYQGSDTVVINREEPHQFSIEPSSKMISFGLDAPDDNQFGLIQTGNGQSIAYGAQPWIDCDDLRCLPGNSGALNAQAALALGCALNLSQEAMLESLRCFEGLPHRFQILGTFGGVLWVNDSKATNVGAAIAALLNVERPSVWIAGGDGKGADFLPLRDVVKGRVHTAILFGRDSSDIADVITDVVPDVKIVENLDEAVLQAQNLARVGDCVLLSPACASLDMFSSYVERGECFARAFQEMQS